jgi:transcriptional regulator with XRE-family HTH domain
MQRVDFTYGVERESAIPGGRAWRHGTAIRGEDVMRIQTRFGREVRRRRHALRMTLDQLAEEAELSPNYLGSIENGKRDPSLSTVQRIADAFGVSIGELVGDREEVTTEGREAAKLFDAAPRSVQASIIAMLRNRGA